MSGISFHCCVSLGSKGIFCPVHFGKSLKWGCQLCQCFPLVFFSDSLEKNPKRGRPHSCICNPNLLLTDTLYYRIQVGLKREVFHMCECVLLAISPEKVWCRLLGILPKWGPRVIVWSCWRWLLVRQPPLLHHC